MWFWWCGGVCLFMYVCIVHAKETNTYTIEQAIPYYKYLMYTAKTAISNWDRKSETKSQTRGEQLGTSRYIIIWMIIISFSLWSAGNGKMCWFIVKYVVFILRIINMKNCLRFSGKLFHPFLLIKSSGVY